MADRQMWLCPLEDIFFKNSVGIPFSKHLKAKRINGAVLSCEVIFRDGMDTFIIKSRKLEYGAQANAKGSPARVTKFAVVSFQ